MRLPSTVIEYLKAVDPALIAAADTGCGGRGGREDPALTALLRAKAAEYARACARNDRLSLAEVMRLLARGRPPELRELLEGVALMHALLRGWREAGSQVLHIVPQLSERLAHTSAVVPSELVRSPFRSVLLVFDDEAAFAAFERVRGDGPAVRGALSILVTEIEADGERRLTFCAVRTRGRKGTRQIYRSILLRDGWTTEQAVQTDWRREGFGAASDDPARDAAGAPLCRLIVNTLLYVGSRSARVSDLRRNDRAAVRDSTNYSPLPHRRVGDGVTFISAFAADGPRSDGGGRSLSNRHVVMGHWKQQAVGPGGRDRRPIWIEPYLRGPELADLVEKPYVVR